MNEDDIVIVACSFRLSPEDMLNRLQRLVGSTSRVVGYIVCSKARSERALAPNWTLLQTDNRDFDFSAYFTGAKQVLEAHPESRAVIFLNDTLFTNHAAAANLKALRRQVGLVKSLELPAIAGKAELYTTVCLRNPWSGLNRYVTTFCFMLNRKALPLMLQLREMAECDGVTLGRQVSDPEWGEQLAPAFRQFLKANLIYEQSPYLWYRLREGKFAPEQLTSKARTIYFEHRLSGAVSDVGCIVPTNAGPRWTTYLDFHERLSRVVRKFGR